MSKYEVPPLWRLSQEGKNIEDPEFYNGMVRLLGEDMARDSLELHRIGVRIQEAVDEFLKEEPSCGSLTIKRAAKEDL